MAQLVSETSVYPGEWLKHESPSWYSREDVTLLGGVGTPRVLTSGMVVGKITASGKYVQMTLGASDGSLVAAGILLLDNTVPVGVDVRAAIIARDAIVTDNGIVWPTGVSSPQIATATAALIALGILVREGA